MPEQLEEILIKKYKCPYCSFESPSESKALKHLRDHQEVTLELTRAELSRLKEIMRYIQYHAEGLLSDSTGRMLWEKIRKKK